MRAAADYSPMAREAAAATSQLLTDPGSESIPKLQAGPLQLSSCTQSSLRASLECRSDSRHDTELLRTNPTIMHGAIRKSHASLRMPLVLRTRTARHGGTVIACAVLSCAELCRDVPRCAVPGSTHRNHTQDVLNFIPRDLMRCACQVCGSARSLAREQLARTAGGKLICAAPLCRCIVRSTFWSPPSIPQPPSSSAALPLPLRLGSLPPSSSEPPYTSLKRHSPSTPTEARSRHYCNSEALLLTLDKALIF